MRKPNLFIGILMIFIIFSCSSDSKDGPQLTMEELLIKGSPWTFNRYEMLNIIDSGNSNFTQTDIEADINQALNGEIIKFNNNGTGSLFLPDEGTDIWNWEIVNDSQLKLIFDNGESDIIENINVTPSQIIIEIEGVSYDNQAKFEVLHNGKYFYQ